MLPLLAGILSTLVANNMPKLAQAVLDKGLDTVEQRLGVKLEPDMSAEKLAEVQAAFIKHQGFLLELEQKNTADARDMNVQVQTTAESSWLAKNAACLMDFTILAATILTSSLAFFYGVPETNKELVYMALGSLLTMSGTVLNFHRGSSSGSAEKTKMLGARNG